MSLTRISTLSLQQTTIANALRVQTGIFEAQKQISSGVKAQIFSEMPTGDVEVLASVEDRLSRADQFKKENNRLLTRVDSTNQALSNLIDLANDMKNLIAQRRNGAVGDNLAFEQQLRSGFQAVATQLNSNVDGRFLFSGSRTDLKPVDETTFPTQFQQGVPDSGYYQGNRDDITSRIDQDQAIVANVRGDDEAFQKLMAGFTTALSGHTDKDDAKLQKAFDFMQDALDGVIQAQSRLGSTRLSIEKANERHDAQGVYWNGVKEDTLNSDVVALATKLSADSATLQATFQTFARINNLKLSDFLG